MSSQQIVDMMRDDKGITFNYVSETDAVDYLTNVNNYMRTAAYRKNHIPVYWGFYSKIFHCKYNKRS